MKRHVFSAVLFGASVILAGCVADGPPMPIPAPMAEDVPRPPVSAAALVWQAGHWDWTGSAYVWVPGQYVTAEGHGNRWVPGYWEKAQAGWIWHPAHWL